MRDDPEEEADKPIAIFGWMCAIVLWVILFWVGFFKFISFFLRVDG